MTALRTRAEFVLSPIPSDDADALLLRPDLPVRVADAYPGFPCRRCLRDAEIGESLVLVSYNPFRGDSPYAQPGPVFLHRDGCRPYGSTGAAGTVPAQLVRRQLSVRAFDAEHLMVDTRLVLGTCLAATARELLEDERVAYLHVHFAAPGCWAARIDRSPDR